MKEYVCRCEEPILYITTICEEICILEKMGFEMTNPNKSTEKHEKNLSILLCQNQAIACFKMKDLKQAIVSKIKMPDIRQATHKVKV